MKNFIAYRDTLLPYSETFIPGQVESLSGYRGTYVGTARIPGTEGSIPAGRDIILSDQVRFPALVRTMFRVAGVIPSKWFDAIAATSPLLVHAHFGPDGLWALPLARRLRVPLVTTFYGYDITVDRATGIAGSKAQQAMYGLYLSRRRKLLEESSLCLAYSDFLRNQLIIRGCPPDKAIVHYVGIDVDWFRPDPSVRRENVVLFVGRLVAKKGCDLLIRAMVEMQDQIPAAELVVIGEGPLRESLERMAARSLVRYRFLGAQTPEGVREWMNRALIFAAPSLTAPTGEAEGLPTVLLEAQAMGLPVVSTTHAGVAEAVIHGETGFLAPESDWRALAQHLSVLLRDAELRERFAAAGRRRMGRDFSLRLNAVKLESIYDDVLEKRARRHVSAIR